MKSEIADLEIQANREQKLLLKDAKIALSEGGRAFLKVKDAITLGLSQKTWELIREYHEKYLLQESEIAKLEGDLNKVEVEKCQPDLIQAKLDEGKKETQYCGFNDLQRKTLFESFYEDFSEKIIDEIKNVIMSVVSLNPLYYARPIFSAQDYIWLWKPTIRGEPGSFSLDGAEVPAVNTMRVDFNKGEVKFQVALTTHPKDKFTEYPVLAILDLEYNLTFNQVKGLPKSLNVNEISDEEVTQIIDPASVAHGFLELVPAATEIKLIKTDILWETCSSIVEHLKQNMPQWDTAE